jgi:ribonuclease HI
LSSESNNNVAEVTAASLAAAAALERLRSGSSAKGTAIFTDSAFVTALFARPISLSAATPTTAINQFFTNFSELQLHAPVALIWIPSHCGLSGNEAADQLACAASTAVHSLLPDADGIKRLTYYPVVNPGGINHTLSDIKRHVRRRVQAAFERRWANPESVGAGLRAVKPVPSYMRNSFTSLNWRTRHLLSCLRHDVGVLNAHLHNIDNLHDPMCAACYAAEESRSHLLLHCPAYSVSRSQLRLSVKAAGAAWPSDDTACVRLLLTGQPSCLSAAEPILQAVVLFLGKTGRFRFLAS